MPKNTKMLSNTDALRRGNARAAWKRQLCLDYFSNQVNYKISNVVQFDDRDIHALIPLLVDISSVANESEEIQKEYFYAKLRVIEQDFVLTKDPSTRLPYLKKMYETVVTDWDIDWDNEAHIDRFFCSVAAQQMVGTMVEKLPLDVLGLYSNKNGAEMLDNISLLNFVYTRKFQNAISRKYKEMNAAIMVSTDYDDTPVTNIHEDVLITLADKAHNKGNVSTFDPTTVNESTLRYFLGGEINGMSASFPNTENPNVMDTIHFKTKDFVNEFITQLCNLSRQTLNEFRTTDVYVKNSLGNRKDLLFINGKSVSALIAEKKEDLGNKAAAEYAVAEMLRDAMTDGKSVVSLMRPRVLEGGKVSFVHQELKVDLDKLNQIERNRNHNAFRRALDYIGLFKIRPKFASNENRDAIQSDIKNREEYKNALKSAEEKFVRVYNETSKQIRDRNAERELKGKHPVKDKFLYNFPEVSIAEENELDNGNQMIENNPVVVNDDNRQRMNSISEVIEDNNLSIEQPIHENSFSKSVNLNGSVK